jgi:hypothetical protein
MLGPILNYYNALQVFFFQPWETIEGQRESLSMLCLIVPEYLFSNENVNASILVTLNCIRCALN